METTQRQETTLELEISRDQGRIKTGTMRKAFGDMETLRHYDEKEIDFGRIEAKCSAVVRLLNNANLRGTLAGENFEQLQQTGFSLFEELLPHDVQTDVSSGGYDNLIINIDDGLVHIPWELLYDGQGFLCRKFNVGRVVRTRQRVVRSRLAKLRSPIKILIICDPCGDLEKAYEEGDRIRNELDKSPFLIHADLFNRRVDSATLREAIRNYDMVHYAGHADYQPDNPDESGWLLCNSKFTSREIIHMSRNLPMPPLVFSNACQSGQTGEWKIEEGFENRIFGLANAFLLAGVQHYVGSFWEILDEASCEFSVSFYNTLLTGEPIGGAVKKARENLVVRYGEENIIWASYMLYGNPGFKYFTLRETTVDQPAALYKNAHPYMVAVAQEFPTGATRSLPPDRKTYNLVLFSYAVIFFAIAAIVFLAWNRLNFFPARTDQPAVPVITAEKPDKESNQRILKALAQKYAEQKKQKAPEQPPADGWTTQPITLSLLGFKCVGDIKEQQELERFFTANLSRTLHNIGQVSQVEREKLNSILEELQLTTSDIADQNMAVIMLGKLLGARLISIGEIIKARGDTSVNLRVFETDTSRIVISLQDELSKEWQDTVEQLAQTLTKEIRKLYPIRGTIVQTTRDEVILNIGTEAGVKPALTFSVLAPGKLLQSGGKMLGYAQKRIGVVKIREAQNNLSYASIQEQAEPFKEGCRVLEIAQ